jgi:pyruvate,water dikinase
MKQKFTRTLQELRLSDLALVGGKNASLGEMMHSMKPMGINIPDGFVVTVEGFIHYMNYNHLHDFISETLSAFDPEDLNALQVYGKLIRQEVLHGNMPEDLKNEILEQYQQLSELYFQRSVDVAVRSSATSEDLPDASFAGQQDTFLNISGEDTLLLSIKKCFASLFTDRAISYRTDMHYQNQPIGLSVCIQKMVRSDKGASGVAFSLDTESGFKDIVLINGSYGLGELVVQGAVSPDEFLVFKPGMKKNFPSIIDKRLGNKNKKMIYGSGPGELTKVVPVENSKQHQFCLNDDTILKLSEWVCKIEDHYSFLHNRWCPMDIEWALDGITGELFITQARPETVHSRISHDTITEYQLLNLDRANVLCKGIAVGNKIGQGKVRKLENLEMIAQKELSEIFQKGDVLVTDMTDPDWEPLMKMASAIVTNKGGRTCHAAIVAREMGIPAIVGTGNATELLVEKEEVTVCCTLGDSGLVLEGIVPYQKEEIHLGSLPESPVSIMLNVGSPDTAFHYSFLPNNGVGLAREEFIINNYIKVHPLAVLEHEVLGDAELSEYIRKISRGFSSEREFFIQQLAFGISRICAAFYPNPVIVRFSDFKSNEYANLPGGKYFEPHEENPMIGWRGASRYYSDAYKPAFQLECEAIQRVREQMGLSNLTVMIPFCRTVEECKKVIETMAEFGLYRGKNGLEIYLMAEIPSNILLADQFARYVDGFSIGSNDLTQLTLGLDRDSSLVAPIYDERNEAVKEMIRMLIRKAHATGTKVGICGQAPSDFPDFATFLVKEGIDSISVTPDSLHKTRLTLSSLPLSLYERFYDR